MKIGGWIVFLVGIALGIWVLVLEFTGGGNGSPIKLLIFVAILIYTGWRLKTYGTGLLPPATTNSLAGSNSILDDSLVAETTRVPQVFTVEIPRPPALSELIRDSTRKSARMYGIIIAIFCALLLGFGALLQYAVKPNEGVQPIKVFPIMSFLSLALLMVGGGIWLFTVGLPAKRDLRESVCLQTRGPVQIVPVFGRYILRLADRAIFVDDRPAVARLVRLDWAVVEYGKHSNFILSVWDNTGTNVYAAAGHRPEFRIPVDANSRM